MSTIEINADTSRVQTRLNAVVSELTRPRDLFVEISEELRAQTREIFDSQGWPANSWQDLARRTKKAREKKGHWPGKILQVSGRLLNSIQSEAGPDYAQIGTNLPQARILFYGGTIQRTGQVRLRTDKKGALKRQKDHDKLAVFAKKSHKLAVTRAVNYSIVIPGRRYFPVTDSGELIPSSVRRILNIAVRRLQKSK
jgi:phage virion morphogenesis protein